MKRSFNAKLFLLLLAVCALLGVGGHFLHAYEAKRCARTFFAWAVEEHSKDNTQQALRYLQHGLSYLPDDPDGLTLYGEVLGKTATTGKQMARAADVLEKVLLIDRSRSDVRRKLATLRLRPQLRQYAQAKEQLTILLNEAPNDSELECQMGQCAEGLAHYDEAKGEKGARYWYEAAIKHGPHNLDAYILLVNLLDDHLNQPALAKTKLDDMVMVNPHAVQAYLIRARHYLAQVRREEETLTSKAEATKLSGEVRKNEGDIREALRLAPKKLDVLLVAADWATTQALVARHVDAKAADAEFAQARTYLTRAIQLRPDEVVPYQRLAELESRAGRSAQATAALRLGLQRLKDKHLPTWSLLGWSLADLLLQQDDAAAAQPLIKEMEQAGVLPTLINYLHARQAMAEGNWAEAIQKLEELRPLLQSSPDVLAGMPALKKRLGDQLDLLLSRCYEEVNDTQHRYETCRRAVMRSPLSVSARLNLAGALEALDRGDEAREEYEKKVLMRVPEAQIRLAGLELMLALRVPPGQRHWEKVRELLDQAAKALPNEARISLLRAEMFMHQEPAQTEAASKELRDACKKWPKNLAVWDGLATFELNQRHPDEARRVLEQAQQHVGDGVAMRLVWAGYWARLGAASMRTHLPELLRGVDKLHEGEGRTLLRRLTDLCMRNGLLPEATKLSEQLVAKDPKNSIQQRRRFELALAANDEAMMRRSLDGLAACLDQGGVYATFDRVRYYIWQAEHGNQQEQNLNNADQLLQTLVPTNPTWGALLVAQGQIDELRQHPDAALRAYRRGIELGETRTPVIMRALQLLYNKHEYAEAENLVRKLPQQAAQSSSLKRMLAELSLNAASSREERDNAMQAAEKAISPDSKDYRDLLWLGEAYFVAGRKADAEKVLRRATHLAPTVPGTWILLVRCLVRTGQQSEAVRTIAEIGRHLPPEQRDLSLGQCWDAAHDASKAADFYERALAAQPQNISVLRATATFYLTNRQPDKAKQYLTRIIDAPRRSVEDERWARRLLAILLATGNYQQIGEALAVLGITDTEKVVEIQKRTIEDQRTLAFVLVRQGTRQTRARAVDILKGLDNRQALQPEDRFLLAQLYDGQGQWPEARQCLLRLLGPEEESPRYLAYYAADLLKQNELDEAETVLGRWKGPLSPVVVRLRADLLAKRNHAADAIAEVQNYVSNGKALPADSTARTQQAALFLGELTKANGAEPAYGDAADEMYRRWVEHSNQPESRLTWAGWLAYRGRVDAALSQCEHAGGRPEQVAFALLGVLHQTPDARTYAPRVERWLSSALRRDGRSSGLQVCLADLRDLQGRYDEAKKLYTAVLAGNPSDLVALNNLAWLLAMKDKDGVQAEGRIDAAIKLAGPAAELLDTRAMARLAAGRVADAIADLQEALTQTQPTAPLVASLHFHLARAYQSANQLEKAKAEWKLADKAGLKDARLHPLDREAYQQLLPQLAGKAGS